MEDESIEIKLEPAPGEKMESPDYQQALRDFADSLRANGIKRSVGMKTMDAAGGVSPSIYNGGFRIAVAVITALGPIAIVQLRKLIEAFLKVRAGRKLKLKFGNVTIEGHAEDVEKLITPKQIAKMLNPADKSAKKTDGRSRSE